jgi:hypothetical protein
MARGGYRKPNNPAPVSGPGKFSRRTDGKIIEPDMDTARGAQYGDRKASIDAQRIAKTAVGAGAHVSSPRQMSGSAPVRGKLPPWLTNTPDTNPAEPTTAGLGMGPGPGSEALDAGVPTDDMREKVLQFWAETYGNQDAIAALAQLRAEQADASGPAAPVMAPEEGLEALPEEAPGTAAL